MVPTRWSLKVSCVVDEYKLNQVNSVDLTSNQTNNPIVETLIVQEESLSE